MNPHAPRAVLLAVALSACSPAVERRAAVPTDTASAAAPSAAVASTRATATDSSSESAADSVLGIVERIGSEPTTQLVVRAANGVVCAVQMTAPPPFEGLEVTLWGRRDVASATMIPGVSCTFAAERYAVRAVDGIVAVDGTLLESESSYALALASGDRPLLRHVPAALRTQVGARIYWAGPLDRAPAAYGVLVPAAR